MNGGYDIIYSKTGFNDAKAEKKTLCVMKMTQQLSLVNLGPISLIIFPT